MLLRPPRAWTWLSFVLCTALAGTARGSAILQAAETRIERELRERLTLISPDAEVSPRVSEDATLYLEVMIPVKRPAEPPEARQLAATVHDLVVRDVRAHYPNLRIDPDSVVKIRPPFSLEEGAPLVASFRNLAESRGLAPAGAPVAPVPPVALAPSVSPVSLSPHAWRIVMPLEPRTGSSVMGAAPAASPSPSPRPPEPEDSGAPSQDPLAQARDMLLDGLQGRFPVVDVKVARGAPGRFRVAILLEEPTNERRRVADILHQLVDEVPKGLEALPDFRGLDPGSRFLFRMVDPETQRRLPGVEASLEEDGWHFRTVPAPGPSPPRGSARGPPDQSSPARMPLRGSLRRSASDHGSPLGPPGLRLEEEPPPPLVLARAEIREALRDPDHLIDVPPSFENLVHIPYPYTRARGSMVLRSGLRARQVNVSRYSRLVELTNLDQETGVTLSPLDDLQYTVTFQRQRADRELAGSLPTTERGEAATFSVKYQLPWSRYLPHGAMAVGTDLSIRSRGDVDLRLPDDLVNKDSLWATISWWHRPAWNLLLSLQHLGVLADTGYTTVALGSEFILHPPLRRFWFELVARSLGGKTFDPVGRRQSEHPYANVGVEFSLGKNGGLVFQVPHAFAPDHQEVAAMLYIQY